MTNTFKPTDAQAIQIKLATRKAGVTRAQLNEAMGWEAETRMPIQQIIKSLAERMGAKFETDYDAAGRAAYRIVKPAKAAATVIAAPAKKSAVVTAKKPGHKAVTKRAA